MKLAIIGGHLSPALAVINALPKDIQVLFIGRKHALEGDNALSLECKTITSLKVPYAIISTGRLQRIITRHTIPSLFKIPYGFIQSFFILRNFKPDVVLGFGGYLSLPVGLSAFILGIPLVIHEQTLEAGAANRILGFLAKRICISWDSSRKFFPKEKTVLTGNPNRISHAEFISASSKILNLVRQAQSLSDNRRQVQNDTKPIIYITGGSSGSHFINTLVEGCIKELLEKFIIIHQIGDAQEYHDFDRLEKLKGTLSEELKSRYVITKFIDPKDIGSVLKKADLVVSRSGINTITELIFFKRPALLIPLPYSQNNEQLKNAQFFKNEGLGEILYQSEDLMSNRFLEVLIKMYNNIDKYIPLRHVRRGYAGVNENAANKIIRVVRYAAKGKKK